MLNHAQMAAAVMSAASARPRRVGRLNCSAGLRRRRYFKDVRSEGIPEIGRSGWNLQPYERAVKPRLETTFIGDFLGIGLRSN